MAHDCPGCLSACYCHGDVDDMLMAGTREEMLCDHCDGADVDYDDDDYWSDLERATEEPV